MITIRAYEDSDQEALLRVWYESSIIAHDFMPASFWAMERQAIIDEYMPIAETWVAEEDRRVIGFHALIDNELGALFVDPARQGEGVGSALMNHAKSLRSHLTLGVFKANTRSRRFYEKHGFRPIGETVEERTGVPIIRMEYGEKAATT